MRRKRPDATRPPTAVPPGTSRRARKAAETREALLRAGLNLFAERGLSGVTVEDITEAADVGKGTFFNYFRSKEHVLAALGDLQLGKIESVLAQARSGTGSFREALERLPAAVTEEPGRGPLLVRSMLAALLSTEPVRRALFVKMRQGRRLLAELLGIGQARGEIRKDRDPAELARILQQAFFGTMVVWSVDGSGSLRHRMEEVMSYFGSALVSPRSGGKEDRT